MKILLLCPGESLAKSQGVLAGQNFETELSEIGQTQAKLLAKYLGNHGLKVEKVMSSPLKDSWQTGDEITKILGLTLEQEPLLTNLNRGQWEGRRIEEIQNQMLAEWEAWKEKPGEMIFPGGESLVDASSRVQKWFAKLDEMNMAVKNHIAAVADEIIIRVILVKMLRRDLDDIWIFDLDNAGITTLEWGKMPQVVEINKVEHLENRN